jgi:hypothetical protein
MRVGQEELGYCETWSTGRPRKDFMNEDSTSVPTQTGNPATAAQSRVQPAALSEDSSSVELRSSPVSWWRIADFGVLGLWVVIVLFTIQHHEKWADEAQAWLLARDLDLRTLWFHELRYEGTPGLWHTILWVAQRVFHARYDSIGYIGMVFATAGVAFMLFKAPFPRLLRWILAFTYFMVYQYAVIGRHYTLFAFLAFAAAHFFSDVQRPERITLVLILLANLTTHGTILAVCLGTAYALRVLKVWPTLNQGARRRFVLCVGAMLMTLVFLFIVLKPPPDVEALHTAQRPTDPTRIHYFLDAIGGPFFDDPSLSAVFLFLAGLWSLSRKQLAAFVFPLLFLVPFYVYVRGWPHQQGTIFLAVMAALWIAWPKKGEQTEFTRAQRFAYTGMIALLACLFAYQSWNAIVIIQHDYKLPYSGGEDAANYLKSVGADRGPIFGYLYGVVAVQAYFDHNILANCPTAYFHHSTASLAAELDPYALKAADPEYLLVPAWSDPGRVYQGLYRPMMGALGYTLVHASDGYLLTKRGWKDRQVYLIFRRVR